MAIKDNKYRGLQKYADGSWGVDCRIRGERYRHKCGTLTEARDYLAELKRRDRLGDVLPIDPQPVAKKTIGDWLEVYRGLLGEKQRGNNQPDLLHLDKWQALFGHMLPEELTEDHLAHWVRSFPQHSPAYKKRQLAVLRRAYSLAGPEGARHPFSDWTRLGLPKHLNNLRDKYMTLEQERDFFVALGEFWCLYAEFSILTGMRWGDQFGLRREHVDVVRGFVMVQQSKHGERQPHVLSDRAMGVLTTLMARHQSPWIFCSKKGFRVNPDNFRERVWRPALITAGMPDFRWHDLRHTTASKLVAAGEDLYTVAKILGQKDHRSAQRYSHIRDEKLKQAAEKISVTGRSPKNERTKNGRPTVKPKFKPKQPSQFEPQ